MPVRHPAVLTAVAGVATLALAACGTNGGGTGSSRTGSSGTGSTNAAPVSNGAAQVHITLASGPSGDSCTIDHPQAKAGPVTFTVINTNATALTELELQSNQRIIGEKENLAPGLGAVKFTTTLGGGTYQIYCPGATKEMQNLTVTGKAAAATGGSASALLASGTAGYAQFVDTQLSAMKAGTAALRTAVDSGNLAQAKVKYAAARPYYEKIESDVDGFVLPGHSATDNAGNLDYLIDMRASNLDPKVGWHGFHAVERDLWQSGRITANTKKLAAELDTNVGKLVTLAKTLKYKPEDLANGAAGLLEEVQSNKIKGEEEFYSHLDLMDFNGNLEGAQQAFAYLKPGLNVLDPVLTKQISAEFAKVGGQLNAFRSAKGPGGFLPWTPAQRIKSAAALSQGVQGLQDPLSRIAEKVATQG
ncbi:iron uptake system protein EfeO [Allobranchiibius sp. CTAmp26]|uniref:iron uptake system protein EfeO n=1 Tax=Allobranchiibius sp. CTAmp26 TaxID=2815214 RepID=UPI001AA11C98|nr:iron uptake system protein EfeO [Allobranchiibius sp. CTAmp26]MBO1754477.1 EfeM/EfeO family lipoprotein [Allobranchiibius sp. CTAmp26]